MAAVGRHVREPSTGADTQLSARRVALYATGSAFAVILGLRVIDSLAHLAFLGMLAALLTIAVTPAVTWLVAHRVRRFLAVTVVYTGGALAALAFAGVLTGALASQAGGLVDTLPSAWDATLTWLNTTWGVQAPLDLYADQLTDTIMSSSVWSGAVSGLAGAAGTAATVLFDLLTVIVFSVYLTAAGDSVRTRIASFLPTAKQAVFIDVWRIAENKTGGFVLGKLALAAISSLAHSIAFAVIGVPYWLAMGVFVGVVSQFIPVIGTFVGVALPAIVAVGTDSMAVVWIIAFAVVYQQIENYVLTPRIASKTMDINPGLAFAGVLAGVALFGPVGALIGMPLVAMIEAVVDTYAARYDLHPELAPKPSA